MSYAKQINGQWRRVPRPDWRNDDGSPASDAVLAEGGYYVLVENPPNDDPMKYDIQVEDPSLWTLDEENGTVTVTYSVTARPLEDVKSRKVKQLREDADNELLSIREEYPETERETWPQQDRESQAYQDWVDAGSTGTAPLTPTLTAIANARGLTLPELVTRVRAKVDTFTNVAGTVVGKRQKLEKQVADATTADEVLAITWL